MGIKKLILFITISSALVGCLPEESGRQGLKLIEDFSVGATDVPTVEACTGFYIPADDTCRATGCPTGTHIATPEEEAQIIQEFQDAVANGLVTPQELADSIEASLSSAAAICAPGSGVLRPDGEVFINPDFCACFNNDAVIFNNCTNFCSTQSVPDNLKDKYILYGSVRVGPSIELNDGLKNLFGWCNNDIPGSDFTAPGCTFQVIDANGSTFVPSFEHVGNTNKFRVDLSSLPKDNTYIAEIRETLSGSNVASDKIQFYLTEPPDTTQSPVGPLKIMPISQYTCFQRSGAQTQDGNVFEAIIRTHFYYASNTNPVPVDPVSGNGGFLYCHDIDVHGNIDSPLFDRLELIPQHFALWDISDIRFLKQRNGNDHDINLIIVERLLNEFSLDRTGLNTFSTLPALTSPVVSSSSEIGYIMIPWINPLTGRGFCPTQTDYNGDDPIFKILKDYVGVDTEGLYIAVKEAEALVDENGQLQPTPPDFIYIRENQLKNIWFYVENGQLLEPNESTAGTKTIMFFWPPDPNDPYTKKDNQKIYTVIGTDSPQFTGSALSVPTQLRPSDKRIGCIPSLD